MTVESDHKQLEAIFKKPLYDCPAQIQRMRMRLIKCDVKVLYKPGKELYLVDALTRTNSKNKEYFMETNRVADLHGPRIYQYY